MALDLHDFCGARPSDTAKSLAARGCPEINTQGAFTRCFRAATGQSVVLVSIETTASPVFFEICRDNPHNPYLPNVVDMISRDGQTVIEVEALVAVDHKDSISLLESDPQMLTDDEQRRRQQLLELQQQSFALSDFLSGTNKSNGAGDQYFRDQLAIDAARLILEGAAQIYRNSGGKEIGIIDRNPVNIFARETRSGTQYVFGDPLMVAFTSPKLLAAENAHRARFGLAPIKQGAEVALRAS